MRRIRVLVARSSKASSKRAHDLFAGLADFDVVGESSDPMELLLKVKRLAADVVVLTAGAEANAALASHLFGEYQELTVLTLTSAGAVIEQLCRTRLLPGSHPSEIVSTLRQAIARPCADQDPRTSNPRYQ
jgi:chemotaxis response regulator CheB